MAKKPFLRKYKETNTVDSETGEIIDTKTHSFIYNEEKDFYMAFSNMVRLLNGLTLPEEKVLRWLLSNLKFNSNRVSTGIGEKLIIAKDMGMGLSSVSNSIVGLAKKEILYKGDGSTKRDATYYVNPHYYWKGDLRERSKVLRVVLEMGLTTKAQQTKAERLPELGNVEIKNEKHEE